MAYGSEDYWMSSNRLLATLMTSIKNAINEGGALLLKLDAIDGKIGDGITLADLNSGECELLAKLLGIETSVETGGTLIDALDALDGTMDGKLSLAQLNSSDVKTNLDTSIDKFDLMLTSFADQLTRLIDIQTNAAHIGATGESVTWSFPAPITRKIAGAWAGRFKCLFRPHPANDTVLYVGHNNSVASGNYDIMLEALDSKSWEHQGEVWVRQYNVGNCTYYFTEVG